MAVILVDLNVLIYFEYISMIVSICQQEIAIL